VFLAVLANTSALLHALVTLERAALPASHGHQPRAVRLWSNIILELRASRPAGILAGVDFAAPPVGRLGCLVDMGAEHGASHPRRLGSAHYVPDLRGPRSFDHWLW
jgi:hypothetical protein